MYRCLELCGLTNKDSCGAKPPHDPEVNEAGYYTLYSHLEFEAKRLIGQPCLREAGGKEDPLCLHIKARS